jgi:hypothetical protein
MGEEVDIILEEGTEKDERLGIIESQLQILASVADLEEGLYDDLQADKIRVVSDALKLINKIQKQLIKEI